MKTSKFVICVAFVAGTLLQNCSPSLRSGNHEEVVAGGLEAAKPFIKVICEAQAELKKIAAKETKEFQIGRASCRERVSSPV